MRNIDFDDEATGTAVWALFACDSTKPGHFCEDDYLPSAMHGDAVTKCAEMETGELWVSNGEYASQVNFCPFCGFAARVPVQESALVQERASQFPVMIADDGLPCFRTSSDEWKVTVHPQ